MARGSVRSADGARISYERSGRGPPIVLLHGTSVDHTRWDPLRPFLDPRATVVAVDRRGRGASGDTAPYAFEREVEDARAVVDEFARTAGGPVDLFGHSFGALVALETPLATGNVRRLVLYEPSVVPGGSPPGFADRIDALVEAGRKEEAVEHFLRELLAFDDGALARHRRDPLFAVRVAAAATIAREDRAEQGFRFDPARYAALRVPTLLLLGEKTDGAMRASTDAVASALPDARVEVLAGEGHLGMATAPALVAAALGRFLDEERALEPRHAAGERG